MGASVAVFELTSYETVADTSVLEELRSSIVEPLIVFASMSSLKTTETVEFVATPVAAFAGETEATSGGVISGVD